MPMKGAAIAGGAGTIAAILSVFDGWVGFAGWVAFGLSLIGLYMQRKLIMEQSKELEYSRNDRELLSDQAAKLKNDLDALDQRFLKASVKMLEMERNMKYILGEEKERDEQIAMLTTTVETNRKTIERLSKLIDAKELNDDMQGEGEKP